MSLIKETGLPVFKTGSTFKYQKAWDYFKSQEAKHWTSDEISLSQDVKDYQKASPEEKEYIKKIMMLFTTNEIQVGRGYATMLRIFKPMEVKAMLSSFNAREYIHIDNYSLFTETIGLPVSIYSDFLDIPVMRNKLEYIDKAIVKKYEDYKAMDLSNIEVDSVYRRDIARMLGVYAAYTEGVSLFAQFAALMVFQKLGKYPGLCDIVIYSIREEYEHLQGNAWLFRTFIEENQDIWDDDLKADIYGAAREIVAYEKVLIDYLNPPHVEDKQVFKDYVEYMADNALNELGMKRNYNITKNPIPFMDDILGVVLSDFFSGVVSEYSKQVEGDWGDIKYDHWK